MRGLSAVSAIKELDEVRGALRSIEAFERRNMAAEEAAKRRRRILARRRLPPPGADAAAVL